MTRSLGLFALGAIVFSMAMCWRPGLAVVEKPTEAVCTHYTLPMPGFLLRQIHRCTLPSKDVCYLYRDSISCLKK